MRASFRIIHAIAVTAGAAVIAAAGSMPLRAQSLAQRVGAADGIVQVIYPSRPAACGDGEGFMGHILGSSTYYTGSSTLSGGGNWNRACVHGPGRAMATVVNGEVTRIRTFVGPVPAGQTDARTITTTAAEAAAWLSDVIARGAPRVASDAMLPLVVADGSEPWPLLLRVSRDENRPRDVRRSALTWLANGVTDHLGIADSRDESADDEMRTQAVFVLSQRPKSESVPTLIDLARTGKYPSVRRSAIFWLGQTGDPRAADVYADLLGMR
jgi:hypothetical protein